MGKSIHILIRIGGLEIKCMKRLERSRFLKMVIIVDVKGGEEGVS